MPIKGSALRADLKCMYKFSYNKLILLIKIFRMEMIYLPGSQLSRVLLTSPTSHFAYSHFAYFRCIGKSHFAYTTKSFNFNIQPNIFTDAHTR